MADYDWNTLLQQWNEALLRNLDLAERNAFVEEDITPEVVASGWLGYPGAIEEQLAALEQRLGTTLPPSYRAFLQTSNGFRLAGNIVPRLLSTDEVAWSRDNDPEPFSHVIEGMMLQTSEYDGEIDMSEWELYTKHLPASLEVSAEETIGTAIYLLNPMVVDADGEWEVLYYAHWIPGVAQYTSFWDLMKAEYQAFLSIERQRQARRKRKGCWGLLRWWDR
jgi:hypothetical protein